MKKIIDESILTFNAATAIIGGIGLIAGYISPPLSLLDHSPFSNYLLPGLILTVVVGGSALSSLIMIALKHSQAYLMTMLSGIIMCGWIMGEVGFIQTTHWLQSVYFILGTVLIVESYNKVKVAFIQGQPR